jgi:O-antigen/teichoic acid export membrane protein
MSPLSAPPPPRTPLAPPDSGAPPASPPPAPPVAPPPGRGPERGSLRSLARNTAFYGIVIVLSRAVSFIMLPVYTKFLTPDDYGVLQLLDMTVDIAAILLVAGMSAGMQRFWFKATTEAERNSIVVTTFVLEVGLSLAGAALLWVLAPLLWLHALEGAGSPLLIRVAAANFTLGVLSAVPLLLLQTEKRVFPYAVAMLARLALQLGLNVLFVVGFRWGVLGILASTLIANVVLGTALAAWLLRRTGLQVRASVLRDLRRFGVPYQISTAGSFILTFGDRFFLQASRTIAEVGLYGLAYQFGFLLAQLSAAPFLSAWDPHRYELVNEAAERRDARYSAGLFYFSFVILTLGVGIALFIRPTLRLMTSPAFWSAADMVPLVLLAYVLQSWTFAVKFGIDVSEQTRYYTYATWASVVVTVALYAALIPRFGGHGAYV